LPVPNSQFAKNPRLHFPEYGKTLRQTRRANWIAQGRCGTCSLPRERFSHTRCNRCREIQRAADKRGYQRKLAKHAAESKG
jgi:hypothetical protein